MTLDDLESAKTHYGRKDAYQKNLNEDRFILYYQRQINVGQ